MANIKISPKGRALLRRNYASSKVVRAIINGGALLNSQEGLTVMVNGQNLKIKAAPVSPSR